jgi:hypothetical protein
VALADVSGENQNARRAVPVGVRAHGALAAGASHQWN